MIRRGRPFTREHSTAYSLWLLAKVASSMSSQSTGVSISISCRSFSEAGSTASNQVENCSHHSRHVLSSSSRVAGRHTSHLMLFSSVSLLVTFACDSAAAAVRSVVWSSRPKTPFRACSRRRRTTRSTCSMGTDAGLIGLAGLPGSYTPLLASAAIVPGSSLQRNPAEGPCSARRNLPGSNQTSLKLLAQSLAPAAAPPLLSHCFPHHQPNL